MDTYRYAETFRQESQILNPVPYAAIKWCENADIAAQLLQGLGESVRYIGHTSRLGVGRDFRGAEEDFKRFHMGSLFQGNCMTHDRCRLDPRSYLVLINTIEYFAAKGRLWNKSWQSHGRLLKFRCRNPIRMGIVGLFETVPGRSMGSDQ